MTTMADYIVLSDQAFELDGSPGGPPDEKILEFNLPSDFTSGTNLARPLLSYVIHYESDDGEVGIWVNPEFPLRQTTRDHNLVWSKGTKIDKGLWESIQGTKFKAGAQNRIIINVQKGRVRFRDVVLWFQRDNGA